MDPQRPPGPPGGESATAVDDNNNVTMLFPSVNKSLLPAFRPRLVSSDNHSTTSSTNSDHQYYEFCGVIGPTNVEGMIACPCCNRPRKHEDRETLNEPMMVTPAAAAASKTWTSAAATTTTMEGSNGDEADNDDDDDVLPGVLARGVEYHPKRILVEGWVHKKGTGNDFFYSRGWKPRWARLALAKVEGYDLDVPLLLIYWYRSSLQPTTVILLESTVVLAVDKDSGNNTKQWNSYRFEIRHVKHQAGVTSQQQQQVEATRTFTVPKTERDMWVGAISQALLLHEKQKAKLRSMTTAKTTTTTLMTVKTTTTIGSPSKPPAVVVGMDHADPMGSSPRTATAAMPESHRPWSPVYDSIWSGDQFMTLDQPHSPLQAAAAAARRRVGSPPSSPRPPVSKRPLPRHDVLAGESLA